MNLETVLEAAKASAKTRQGRNQIECIQFADEYAEPGYSDPEAGIAFGDWNTIGHWNEEMRQHVVTDDIMVRLARVLEAMGYALEWEDEWTTCDNCYRAVRISPDSYCWKPSYTCEDGEVTCDDCIDPEEYLEDLEGDAGRCNQLSAVDPEDHGYSLVKDRFEHGFHTGMDADPKLIAELLEKLGCARYVFHQTEQSQFYVSFAVYLHDDEQHLLEAAKLALEEGNTDGPSVSAALRRGLEEVSRQADALRAEQAEHGGVIVSKVRGDEAATRLVSEQDFVEGRALDD